MTQIEENDGYKNAFTLVIAAVLGRNYRFLRKSRVVLNTRRRSAGEGKRGRLRAVTQIQGTFDGQNVQLCTFPVTVFYIGGALMIRLVILI